jgi:asparagine synthase (glutamine-hydrolysing)
MCSIAGIIHLKKGAAEGRDRAATALERMMRALHHRGPDDRGLWLAPEVENVTVGLANTRLAILDLSPAGHQPMLDQKTGCALTYNGEAYNYLDLRGQLSETVGEWRSHTDTEVVLKAYEQWGVAGLERLRGMFALALWDAPEGRLVLARDPLGIKPLYYYRTEELFIFASEIRALLASGMVPRKLSPQGLASYLESGSVEAPATIVDGVRSLMPGHYLTVSPRAQALHVAEPARYGVELGTGGPASSPAKRDDAVMQLREILEDSVRRHLISDVPLGVFLSGGIDSSALVSLMSRVAGERVKSFSVVFAEEKFSEASHAKLVSEQFGTEHREIPLGEEGLLALLPEALDAIDQPTMDGINTFVVSKSVKQAGITVALSGLGGDELFAGYNTFHRGRQLQSWSRIPRPFRRVAATLGQSVLNGSVQQRKFWELMASDGSPRAAYDVTRQLFASREMRSLLRDAPLLAGMDAEDTALDTINAVSRCELEGYMVNTLLRDTDFMSMAHSLEVRVPFVDALVVDFVLRLPGAWKVNGGRAKPLLQDALNPPLPDDITQRPKMGFTFPFEQWMRSRLRDELTEVFADEKRFEALGLRPQRVQETWRRFLEHPRRVGWSRPWALYVLAKWSALHGVTL